MARHCWSEEPGIKKKQVMWIKCGGGQWVFVLQQQYYTFISFVYLTSVLQTRMEFFQLFLYTFPGAFVSKDVNWKGWHFHAKRRNVYFKNTQVPSYNITCWILDARLALLGRWMWIWKGSCQSNWALQLIPISQISASRSSVLSFKHCSSNA